MSGSGLKNVDGSGGPKNDCGGCGARTGCKGRGRGGERCLLGNRSVLTDTINNDNVSTFRENNI